MLSSPPGKRARRRWAVACGFADCERHLPGDLGDNEEHARDYRDLSSRAHLDSFRWWIDESTSEHTARDGVCWSNGYDDSLARLA
jgi:hypothetical protein